MAAVTDAAMVMPTAAVGVAMTGATDAWGGGKGEGEGMEDEEEANGNEAADICADEAEVRPPAATDQVPE